MNRKMGISTTHGAPKTDFKNQRTGINGTANGKGKRRIEDAESDSEGDSKTRLVKKLSSKKLEWTQIKKKKPHVTTVHPTIRSTSSEPSLPSPKQMQSPVTGNNALDSSVESPTHSIGPLTLAEAEKRQRLEELEDAEKLERKLLKKKEKKEKKKIKKNEEEGSSVIKP